MDVMNERFVKRFQGTMTRFAEDELNRFLEANPDYRIKCMTYVNQSTFYWGIIAYFEKINRNTKDDESRTRVETTKQTDKTENVNINPSFKILEPPECPKKTVVFEHKPQELFECPVCGKVQRAIRSKCVQCGTEFFYRDSD